MVPVYVIVTGLGIIGMEVEEETLLPRAMLFEREGEFCETGGLLVKIWYIACFSKFSFP